MSGVSPPRALVIACGALAHEVVALRRALGADRLAVQCLPADLHNHPQRIPGAVRDAVTRARGRFARVFVAYADCGTGGLLDAVLAEEGVERLPGAHCYEVFAGSDAFAELAAAEPGTFFLTDFLARHFERLVVVGLGLDRHPRLALEYFRHYRRVVYLSQREDAGLLARAEAAAARLGLAFEHRPTGYGALSRSMVDWSGLLAAADPSSAGEVGAGAVP